MRNCLILNYMRLIEQIKEWYLTRKTGITQKEREYNAWYLQNVNAQGPYIKDVFKNFKHIIVVDPNKFFNFAEPFGWVICDNAAQYFWPARPLSTTAIVRSERVISSSAYSHQEWYIDAIHGEYRVFVATNITQDAIMITLKYT